MPGEIALGSGFARGFHIPARLRASMLCANIPGGQTGPNGGQGGSRTLTSVSPTTFEAVASAGSATCPN